MLEWFVLAGLSGIPYGDARGVERLEVQRIEPTGGQSTSTSSSLKRISNTLNEQLIRADSRALATARELVAAAHALANRVAIPAAHRQIIDQFVGDFLAVVEADLALQKQLQAFNAKTERQQTVSRQDWVALRSHLVKLEGKLNTSTYSMREMRKLPSAQKDPYTELATTIDLIAQRQAAIAQSMAEAIKGRE